MGEQAKTSRGVAAFRSGAAESGTLGQVQGLLRTKLFPRRHTALLVALVVAFAARPLIGDVGIAPMVFSIALILLMLVSLYNVQVDELIGEGKHCWPKESSAARLAGCSRYRRLPNESRCW